MTDVTIKQVRELDYYQGPHAVPGIKFRYAGKQLGVSAWGMNVIELAADCSGYPEHDHRSDRQEEVYIVLEGQVLLDAGGTRSTLEAGAMVRVGPNEKRKFVTGPKGALLLAIGATPGEAYKPR